MNALNIDPNIIGMANALNLKGEPVSAIMEYCRKRVAKLLKMARSVKTPWDLERLVCEDLNLVIHEVWNDNELEEFRHRYSVEEDDGAFAALGLQLDGDAYGVLFQRKRLGRNEAYQYVAFIDCRGAKRLRRFFTRWHEIAHCLTSYEQFEMPFRRTGAADIEKDPIEKLMDMIAGDLGFFEPLFRPVFDAEMQGDQCVTFDIAEKIRSEFCPDASFQSVLAACSNRSGRPTILIEAAVAFKKTEQRLIREDPAMKDKLQPQLRVKWSVSNPSAHEIAFQIPRYMRVPKKSIISKVLLSQVDSAKIPGEANESLGWWTSSRGGSLPETAVLVQAIKHGDGGLAIIVHQEN